MVLILNDPRVIEHNARQDYLAGDILALVDLLKSDKPLSTELRAFVAGILEGKIKKKRGVKKVRAETFGEIVGPIMLLHEVEELAALLKLKNSVNPLYGFDAKSESLEIVANRHNLTSERLDKIIYPRNQKKPKT